MFEHVPQAVPPPQSQPLPQSTAGKPKPLAKPLPPPVSAAVVADQASIELFKRTSLTTGQKVLVVGVALVVIAVLVGVGIWLYTALDPFSGVAVTNANNSDTNNADANIPLQELDTDKDGLRDIDEKRYGSDPSLGDTDGDGLNDYLEVKQYATDPALADTDGDGYADKSELDNGYDPNGPGRLVD